MKMRFWVVKSSKQPEKKKQESGRPYDVSELIEAYYRNSWHAACINLKTICILGDGIESPEVVNKLQECVRGDSVFTLLHKTILDLRIFGDAFWEVVKTGSGVEIYHIPSWTVSAGKDGGWIQELGNKKVEFGEEDIWHFLEPGMLSQVWGCPDYLPLINDGTIESISTIKTFNNNFFKNNAIPDGILFVKGGDIAPATQYGLNAFSGTNTGAENAAKFLHRACSGRGNCNGKAAGHQGRKVHGAEGQPGDGDVSCWHAAASGQHPDPGSWAGAEKQPGS
ncbi:hypothetical protein MASR1M36_08960 [Candidatus Cloacimonadaceae bacterium]